MAVLVELNFSGSTLDQYDEVLKKMGFTPGGTGAPGGLFHNCMATDDGFRVIDTWVDQATFEKFSEEKIGPLSAEVGMTTPPEVTFTELHNYLTAA
jgi:hypothetical protein